MLALFLLNRGLPKILIAANVLVFSILVFSILPSSAQEGESDSKKTEVHQRFSWFEQHMIMAEVSLYSDNVWQAVGPTRMSGRAVDVAVHPDRPETLFLATAAGGVWKSSDDGVSWNPVFEDYETASIGDVAIAPSDPDVVWIGTGESNILRSSMAGSGVFKSTDGGGSFKHMGLTETHHIGRIVIHPTNPDIVYVAASGHEYTSNPERGVFKSVDGGETWDRVFYKNDSTSVIDLVIDPKHPGTLYAGTAPRLRRRWNDPVGGPETGVYKTIDDGRTWTSLSGNGLPDFMTGQYERIGIDLCASQPETVYVLLNHDGAVAGNEGAKVYRSDDYGEHFRLIEGNAGVRTTHPSYGWFFGQIRVDPSDAETLFVVGLSARVSHDGGYTWTNLRGSHVDYHGAWINPNDSDHIVMVNDGGIMISHDGFKTFHHPTNMQIAHGYNCGVSQDEGQFWIYASMQDTGGWRGLVDLSRGRAAIVPQPWESATGDEAGRHVVDPTHSNIVYSVSRYGGGPLMTDYSKKVEIRRRGRRRSGYKLTDISVKFKGDAKRAQWVSPLIMSTHSPSRLFYGAQFVFLSDDRGENWEQISPDLTDFDPDKQGNIPHGVVFSITESPVEKGVIYAGTDDGNVQVTRDNGQSWTNVSDGLPTGRCIASLEAGHFEAGTVYAAVNGKRHDDLECYLYRSRDYGKNWERISSNIPGSSANVIKQDPGNRDLLYVGTDRAVYVSTNGGERWEVLGFGLPTVYVHDLALQTTEDFVVITTHGRGCYVLDIRDLRH